jgi:hypothetical protein
MVGNKAVRTIDAHRRKFILENMRCSSYKSKQTSKFFKYDNARAGLGKACPLVKGA